MRAILISLLVAGLGAACASRFEGDENGFDQGEASAPRGRDGGTGAASSSSGGTGPRGDGGTGPQTDGGAGSSGDAGIITAPCDPSKGIENLGDVPGLVDAVNYRAGARLSADELTVAFMQQRNPDNAQSPFDVYLATRASKDQPFGNLTPVAAGQTVWDVALSPDALTMYFTPKQPDASNGVQVATRTTLEATFGGPAQVTNVPAWSKSAFPTADGRLVFAAYPSQDPSTIQQAPLTTPTAIGGQQLLFGTAGLDVDYPTLSSDGAEVFYTVYLDPSGDTFAYRRAVRQGDGSYAGAAPLPGLDETAQEVSWVSADACRIYVTDWTHATLRMGTRIK